MHPIISQVNQIVLILLSIALFVLGYTLASGDKTTAAGLFVTAGVLVLIFAFLAKFKRFKGMGIEAELWEEKMEEAARMIDRLRDLTVVSSKPIAHLVATSGLPLSKGITRSEMNDWMESVSNQLNSYHVPAHQIAQVLEPVHRRVEREMCTVIADGIRACIYMNARPLRDELNRLPTMRSSDDNERAKKLSESISRYQTLVDQLRDIMAPTNASRRAAILRDTIETSPLLTTEQRQILKNPLDVRLADLQHYENHRTHRDSSLWASREWTAEREWVTTSINPELDYARLAF